MTRENNAYNFETWLKTDQTTSYRKWLEETPSWGDLTENAIAGALEHMVVKASFPVTRQERDEYLAMEFQRNALDRLEDDFRKRLDGINDELILPLTRGLGGPVIGEAILTSDGHIRATITDQEIAKKLKPKIDGLSIGDQGETDGNQEAEA